MNGETIGNQSETAGRLIEQSIASNDVERKVLSWYLTFSLDDDGKLKIDQINRLRVLNRYNEIKENQSPETTEELNGNPTDMAVETI